MGTRLMQGIVGALLFAIGELVVEFLLHLFGAPHAVPDVALWVACGCGFIVGFVM
jgi:hypothetical protein